MDIANFSTPQWRERKLKRFLFYVYKHEPVRSDEDYYQLFFATQADVENKLRELYNNNKKEFFNIFSSDIFDNLGKTKDDFEFHMRENNNIWEFLRSIKFYAGGLRNYINSPFLKVYALATKKSNPINVAFVNAVNTLTNYFWDENIDFSDINLPLNDHGHLNLDIKINNRTSFPMVSQKYYFSEIKINDTCYEVLTDLNVYSNITPDIPRNLINIEYIKNNRQAPIFIVNSTLLALQLQKKCSVRFNSKNWKKVKTYIDRQCKLRTSIYNDGLSKDPTTKALEHIRFVVNALVNGGPLPDKIFNHTSYNQFLQISPISYSLNDLSCDIVWSSFYGGTLWLNQIDLTPLSDRNVYWVLHQETSKEKFLEKFLRVYSIICDKGIKDLQFIHVPEITDTINSDKNNILVLSPKKLLLEAFDLDLEIPNNLNNEMQIVLTKERAKRSTKEYIIYPAIRKKAQVLLSAKQKHGKSYLAMIFSYAAATGGKLFSNWKVEEKVKVLYILDREVDILELRKRKEKIEQIFKEDKKSKSVTFEIVNNFNLLKIEYQKQVEKMLQNTQLKALPRGEPVRLIVLDHLTKLTQQATGEKAWGSLRPWFDYLIHDLNLSVLFLHHTSKKGEVYGSSHIVNDVNSQIHINKRSEELEGILPMNITLEENRHGENIKKPIEVNLFLEGKPRLCSNTEDKIANRELWKSLKDEELITEFVRLKQLKRPKKTMSEIANYFGVSKPTIEAFAKKNNLTKGKWKNHIPPLDETMLDTIPSE